MTHTTANTTTTTAKGDTNMTTDRYTDDQLTQLLCRMVDASLVTERVPGYEPATRDQRLGLLKAVRDGKLPMDCVGFCTTPGGEEFLSDSSAAAMLSAAAEVSGTLPVTQEAADDSDPNDIPDVADLPNYGHWTWRRDGDLLLVGHERADNDHCHWQLNVVTREMKVTYPGSRIWGEREVDTLAEGIEMIRRNVRRAADDSASLRRTIDGLTPDDLEQD